jgi:hypothetical protein
MIFVGIGIFIVLVIGVVVWFGKDVVMNQVTRITPTANPNHDNVASIYQSMFADDTVPYTNFQTERIFDDKNSFPEESVTVL